MVGRDYDVSHRCACCTGQSHAQLRPKSVISLSLLATTVGLRPTTPPSFHRLCIKMQCRIHVEIVLCICICSCMCMCTVHIHMPMCVYMCMCMYMCMHMHVHAYAMS